MAQIETIRVNVLGMLNLADICYQKQVHLTTYATGTPWLDSPAVAAKVKVLPIVVPVSNAAIPSQDAML